MCDKKVVDASITVYDIMFYFIILCHLPPPLKMNVHNLVSDAVSYNNSEKINNSIIATIYIEYLYYILYYNCDVKK